MADKDCPTRREFVAAVREFYLGYLSRRLGASVIAKARAEKVLDLAFECASQSFDELDEGIEDAVVIVKVSGGVVQGAVCDFPVDLVVIDYDTDGCDEDQLTECPEADGTIEVGYSYREQPLFYGAYCTRLSQIHNESKA